MKKKLKAFFSFSLVDTLKTVLIIVTAIMVTYLIQHYVIESDSIAFMISILVAFLTARFTKGYFYGIFVSFLGFPVVNYLFIEPYGALSFQNKSVFNLICMLVIAIITCTLTRRLTDREQIKIDIEREKNRSNLLRAISHDLRTPLASILGACSVVKENGDVIDKEERDRLLTGAIEDSQWLIRMVENLLTVTRIDENGTAKLKKQPEIADEVVETAVAAFKKRFPNSNVIIRMPSEEIIVVSMDIMLISQVIMNLLENVEIHAKTATKTVLSVVDKGKFVEFSVSDNGVGMDEETLENIFKHGGSKLKNEDESYDAKKSMGIGLSVCNTIVKTHGGVMKAENALGGGARFVFTLPKEAV